MFQISGIIVDKSGRDYSGNMENSHDLKAERNFNQVTKLTEQNSPLANQNAQLQKKNTALVQRVSKLERSEGLNSGNSSKPPSSDGLAKPSAKENRRTQSQRDTSNRKSGGQPGHKGTTLKQVKNPDKVTNHFPLQCQECEAVLSPEESIQFAARQVFDLPPPPPNCCH